MAKYFKLPFGVNGDRTDIPETSPPGGEVNYDTGFGVNYQLDPDTDPDALNVPRNETNELLYQITLALQQYQQRGFPDFITTSDNGGTPYSYSANATVRYNGVNYYSLVDANTSLPTDTTKWSAVTYAIPEFPGTSKKYWGATLPAGYVWENGTTIGNAASGATGRANSDTAALYAVLWAAMSNAVLPIQDSAGAASTRGVSAAADFAANKRLPVPDSRSRVTIGKDDMGGVTAAGRVTALGSGIDGATLGASGGAQNVSLSSNQNGIHAHSGTTDNAGQHNHTSTIVNTGDPLGFPKNYPATGANTGVPNLNFSLTTSNNGAHTHTFTTTSSGLGEAHQNMQPSIVCNWIIKL